MRNKKTLIAIISVVAVILVLIGVTYAYWLVTKEQQGENVISSACLDISMTGSNDINLPDQFPMSDEDGMETIPYTFTVTNNCTTSIDYQVNLETLGDSTTSIKASAIKVALNNDIKLLTADGNTEPTLNDAFESNRLAYGTLAGKSADTTDDEVTYELRLWIDKDAPISEQNKTFTSKITVIVGQGVFNPYKEGTLAYDILENYGGADAITELSTEYDHRVIETFVPNSSLFGYTNFGTSYSFDETTKKYSIGGTITYAKFGECMEGKDSTGQTLSCGKYFLDTTYNGSALFELTTTTDGTPQVKIYQYVTQFKSIEPESSLNKSKDDLGDSYYFRGNPTNNYVKFGSYKADTIVNGKTYSVETPLYWRIVRINGDGTIRIIYDGTEPTVNGVSHNAIIGTSQYNSIDSEPKHLGYTYDDGTGNQVDSTIKEVVDAWYEAHIKNNYGKYIADSIFCNDKSIAETREDNSIVFSASKRLTVEYKPTLICANKSDRYTTKESLGNGYLSNPVGLMSADELTFAGNFSGNPNPAYYYLYTGSEYNTMTPDRYSITAASTMVFIEQNWGAGLSGEATIYPWGVRPVINLKADVKFTGDGRIDTNTPYEIVME